MTTAADDSAVEEAFEAVRGGRHVPEQGADLAAFAGAVLSSASVPGRPNAALADLLANGLLVHQPSPSARTASTPGRPRASRARIRRRIAMFFPALIAKIASAGAVAQAAAGAGVVLVAFAGAGTVGALPDSLQHGFATVAQTVGVQVDDPLETDEEVSPTGTPTTTADASEESGSATDADVDDASQSSADDEEYSLEDWEAGPTGTQSFSDWVSKGARHGYADGAIISREAHEKGIVLPEETTEPATETADDAGVSTAPSPGNAGNGNGNGSAGGNRGSSDNGNSNGNSNGNGNAGGNGSGHGNG
jgi:uncharacterized membrane protein YgcG